MSIQELNFKPLTLNETLTHLQEGGIIVVSEIESTTKKDILVRLDPRALPVTQISYDKSRAENSEYFKPFWTVFDIPFNYFVTRTIYAFTEDYQAYPYDYGIGDNVEYYIMAMEEAPTKDTAYVENIYYDTEREEYLFKLSGRETTVKARDIIQKL